MESPKSDNGSQVAVSTNPHSALGTAEANQALPGLPDELAILCLARVPRNCYGNLSSVCKKWRRLLSSDVIEFYRRAQGVVERWIYALSRDDSEHVRYYVLDPAKRKWKELPGLPNACSKRYGMAFEVLGRKLYLLGGCGWTEEVTNEVYCYDPLANKWETVAGMVKARCHFACASYNGHLYAIGGLGENGSLTSCETYDPEANKWTCNEDPNIIPDIGEALAFDSRIYIRHISTHLIPDPYAAQYDLKDDKWSIVDNEMAINWLGPAILVGNDVYMLDQTAGGIKLMKLDKENNSWMFLGRLHPSFIRMPCRLAAIGNVLYVIGRGLQTLVVDMDNIMLEPPVIVTSKIEGLGSPDAVTISCRSIAF